MLEYGSLCIDASFVDDKLIRETSAWEISLLFTAHQKFENHISILKILSILWSSYDENKKHAGETICHFCYNYVTKVKDQDTER